MICEAVRDSFDFVGGACAEHDGAALDADPERGVGRWGVPAGRQLCVHSLGCGACRAHGQGHHLHHSDVANPEAGRIWILFLGVRMRLQFRQAVRVWQGSKPGTSTDAERR